MTQEQRLARLERIALLFAKAGRRVRRNLREHDDKIDHLVNLQLNNEEKFAKLAESQASLAESEANTNRRLDALIDVITDGRNGGSSQNN